MVGGAEEFTEDEKTGSPSHSLRENALLTFCVPTIRPKRRNVSQPHIQKRSAITSTPKFHHHTTSYGEAKRQGTTKRPVGIACP